jgi:predicted hydrocarbon binding protein
VHGFIFSEIKKYVETKFDRATWVAILENAGLTKKEYENFREYGDEEAVAIVGTASEMTGIAVADVLEDFGFFLGGDLLKVYRPIIDREWKTIDFLSNVEETIHHVVRTRNQARPPALVCNRLGPKEVMILYRSPRKMCALARGIARGVAEYYGEEVTLNEESCMHQGAASCQIRVKVA